MNREAALELFNAKWTNVTKVVNYYCDHLGIGWPDREDLLQNAGVALWQRCLHCVKHGQDGNAINAQVTGLAAFERYR